MRVRASKNSLSATGVSLDRSVVTTVTVTGAFQPSSVGNEIFIDTLFHFVGRRGTASSYSSPRNHPGGVRCR